MAGISAVVFDIGGVLLDWNPRHLYRQLIPDQAAMEDFLGQICTPQWHLAHDLGADIGPSCQELARRHPDHADLILAWAERGEEMIAGQLDEGVAVLAEVKAAGVRCFALSNMEAETYAVRRHRYPFFGMFDGCVSSAKVGSLAPTSRSHCAARSRTAVSKTNGSAFGSSISRHPCPPIPSSIPRARRGGRPAEQPNGYAGYLFSS